MGRLSPVKHKKCCLKGPVESRVPMSLAGLNQHEKHSIILASAICDLPIEKMSIFSFSGSYAYSSGDRNCVMGHTMKETSWGSKPETNE